MFDITFEPRDGESIYRCAQIMCELAKAASKYLSNVTIRAVFNDTFMQATYDSTVESVLQSYISKRNGG